jgi:probable F420-dependent oxidoreductase
MAPQQAPTPVPDKRPVHEQHADPEAAFVLVEWVEADRGCGLSAVRQPADGDRQRHRQHLGARPGGHDGRWTLAEAYPGRFVLGIGVSHGPIVDARGHRYQRPLDKMRGYLDAMDAAPWQGPPLAEEPPLVLAALGPPMLELAAERSAGALLYNATPEATATARSVLGPGPLLAVEQAVLLKDDPAEARGICREFMTLYLTLPNYTGAWDRLGPGPEEQAEGGSDRMVDAVVAWGGPEVITERVHAHLDAGADHVCVQVLDPDPNGLPMTSWRALAPALLER